MIDDPNNALTDELLAHICGEIAIGSTLVKACATRGVPYKLVNRWIADDAERQKRYKLALDIREDHAKDLIISELIAYMKADITQAFDADGNLLKMHVMGENERRLIAGVKFREIFEKQTSVDADGKKRTDNVHVGNIIEVKFWDKPRSIETFMKHLSMLVERKDVNMKVTLADLIAGEMK
jgi:hypothetical protein